MNSFHVPIALLALISFPAWGQVKTPASPLLVTVAQATPSLLAQTTITTPAENRINGALRQLATNPQKVQAYNDLALAYIAHARETADPQHYTEAAQALRRGFVLDPNNFQLKKTRVALLLGQQDYKAAKEEATLLNHQVPDDVMTYGYLAEAEMGLGDNAAAEKHAQWMLNMRPNNIPGLLLGARLRVVYGNPDGALELLKLAYGETSPTEVEELAWIANQIATIQIDAGHPQAALPVLQKAEQLFPNYPATRANLARLHTAESQASVVPASPGEPIASATGAAFDAATAPAAESRPSATLVVPSIPFAPVPPALLVPTPTSTELTIRHAQSAVERNPKSAPPYAQLGAAYFQRARETGDVSDYEAAEKSLHLSLDIVSSDFSAEDPLESLAEVCMGEHRFADALTFSQKALALGSGDVSPFAIVGDADADMGEYNKAAAAYARLTPRDMVLSPRAAYARDSRLSYLDFIAGNTSKAISLMKTAVAEGIAAQLPRENLAWLYYELGEYLTQSGDSLAANAAYLTALETHPGDYRALAGLAKLRANNGRYAEASDLYARAIAVVPMPIFVAELGDVYAKTGHLAEAKQQYGLVVYIGLLGKINQVLHNRDLALFYADHDQQLPEALALAQKEFEVRHDIYTWDALAWALYKNGRLAEAHDASAHALEHGTQDALLLYHAGVIAAKLGDSASARKDLTQALAINPHFHLIYADAAAAQLAALNTQVASAAITESHAH